MKNKLNEYEEKILRALAERWDSWGEGGYFNFKGIAKISGVPLEKVRRNVRSLARKGLAEFMKGLVDGDGMMAGAGYSATEAGAMRYRACIDCKEHLSIMRDGRCDECWHNRPCKHCGKAYREHESDWKNGGSKKEFEFEEGDHLTK